MRFKPVLPLLALPLLLSGCGGSSSSSGSSSLESSSSSSIEPSSSSSVESESSSSSKEPESSSSISSLESSEQIEDQPIDVNVSFLSAILKDQENRRYDVSYDVNYNDIFFASKPDEYSKDLAKLSMGNAMVFSKGKSYVGDFYEAIGFSSVFYSEDFEKEESPDQVKYVFAHKTIGNSEVIAVSVQGIAYGAPWASNALIGKEGNASGFQFAADRILEDLKEYIEPYEDKPIKYWLSGYSRGSAILNIACTTLLEDPTYKAKEDAFFAYLFASPKVVDASNAKPYPCVYNIMGEYDPFSEIFPEAYGLVRVGKEIRVKFEDMDRKCDELVPGMAYPAFVPANLGKVKFSNERELLDIILETLTKPSAVSPDSSSYVGDASTRENYADYIEESFSVALGLFLRLDTEVLSALGEKLSSLTSTQAMTLLSPGKLYAMIAPVLDEYGVEYDKESLLKALNRLARLVNDNGTALLLAYFNDKEGALMSSMINLFCYHSQETFFAAMMID